MVYTELTFTLEPNNEAIADALISELATVGYDGFSYTDSGFKAYIPAAEFTPETLENLELLSYFSEQCHISFTRQDIPDQDWNKVWEDHFTPILIDGKIQVRAGFHAPVPGTAYDIIIEPKMSFGTGHHSTTALMLKTIFELSEQFKDKRVLDMGCGTGILSIMTAKVGAREVTGIDIDDWAFNNAMENIGKNDIDNIRILIGDARLLQNEAPFDIILANINRNILLDDMQAYHRKLIPGGYLIMSGFYLHDLPAIREKADSLGLHFVSMHEEQQWVAAVFYKN